MTAVPLRPPLYVIAAVIFFDILFSLSFLIFHFSRGWAVPFSYAMIIPAAYVQGIPVSYTRVAELTNGILVFSPELSRSQAFEQALARSVQDAAIRSLAEELNVHADEPAADEDAAWDVAKYKKYISKPLLLAQKTEGAVLASSDYQELSKTVLLTLKGRIVEGMPFADAARRFSEDVSGGSGGELGTYPLVDVPAWLRPAADLEPREVSDILEGPDAYWLITVVEKGGDEGEEWVHFQGIAAKKVTLLDVIDQRMTENPPWVFVW